MYATEPNAAEIDSICVTLMYVHTHTHTHVHVSTRECAQCMNLQRFYTGMTSELALHKHKVVAFQCGQRLEAMNVFICNAA